MAGWQPSHGDDFLAALAEITARRVVELLRDREAAQAPDRWLSTAEAAAYLGMSRDTLRKLAAAGQIPSEQDGPNCKRHYRRSELDGWRQSGGRPTHLRSVA